jgi:hypothetical protein
MSKRYAEFRQELAEDGVNLAGSYKLKHSLESEIVNAKSWKSGDFNLRVAYAESELEAVKDHIAGIEEHMRLEEEESR